MNKGEEVNNENLSNIQKPGLFRDKFYTDWAVLLGAGTAALGAFSATRNYGNIRDLVPYDFAALAIDAGIGAVFNAALFGYLPAVLRRRNSKKEIHSMGAQQFMPAWKFPVLVLILSTAAVFAGINSNDDSAYIGTTGSQCLPKGQDEVCIESTYLGDKKLKIKSTWKYSTVKQLDGYEVSSISWVSRIDCNSVTAYVEDLKAYDLVGNFQDISLSMKNQMINGIESEQLRPTLPQMCAKM